ncbi:MAG: hypothetical protein GX801_04750 [Fibrobacter sp.]|nr:hypothetical protein [Fibrobacter sp.]
MTDEMCKIVHNKDHLCGMQFLREWVAYRWLRSLGMEAMSCEVLIVKGFKPALELISQVVLKEPATVLVDEGVAGQIEPVFAKFEAKIVEVERKQNCLDMLTLSHELRGTSTRYVDGAALYYTNPGSLADGLGAECREELAAELNRHIAVLVEEISDSPIHLRGVQNGIIIGDFQKYGQSDLVWLWAPPSMINELMYFNQSIGEWPCLDAQANLLGMLWDSDGEFLS